MTTVRNYARGSRVHCAKLNADKVREIRRRADEKNIALAAEFNTTESNIEHIHNRRTWKWVA